MSKLRLLFVKEGPAAYISNLDLLRTVQRAFPRTELDIKHSQGFHPSLDWVRGSHLHRAASAGVPVQRLRAAGL